MAGKMRILCFWSLLVAVSLPDGRLCCVIQNTVSEQCYDGILPVVTDFNYAHAESQIIFKDYASRIGMVTGTNGVGRIMHNRKPMNPSDRTVVKPNFDTLYSMALLDMKKPVKIHMPKVDRYQSGWFISENHYNPVALKTSGTYCINPEDVDTRYVMVLFRTAANMKSPEDLELAYKAQNQIILETESNEDYHTCDWNIEEVLSFRNKYIALQHVKLLSPDKMFGKKGEISLENHNIGTANGWGGLTADMAVYLFYRSEELSPKKLVLEDVPIASNGFWSVTVYDRDGFVAGDPYNVNSQSAKYTDDSKNTAIVNFGGDLAADNYIEMVDGFTMVVRLYLPTEAYGTTWVKPALLDQ